MKSDLAAKLKHLLDNMSQEQFDASWAEVTALNLKGTTIEEYFSEYATFKFDISRQSIIIVELNILCNFEE